MSDFIPWSLFIDIEGFGYMYTGEENRQNQALWLLNQFMLDIYKIGTQVYCDDHERLFVHQVGDGFIIYPDFGDKNLDRPVSIAIALTRLTILRGGCLKTSISFGGHADITGCYPDEIREEFRKSKSKTIRLGSGLMSFISVMGDALVNAHNVSKFASGPLLILDKRINHGLDSNNYLWTEFKEHIEIDWINSASNLVEVILKGIGETNRSVDVLKKQLQNYINVNRELTDMWKKGAMLLINS